MKSNNINMTDLTANEKMNLIVSGKKLKPGTIIFTRNKIGLNSSTLIQAGQGGKWSHVLMYLGDGDVIETNKNEGIEIKKTTEALGQVDEALFMIPKIDIDKKALRTKAETLKANNKTQKGYNTAGMLASGAIPIAKHMGTGLTIASLSTAAITASISLVIVPLCVGILCTYAAKKLSNSFSSRDEMLKKMPAIYKSIGIQNKDKIKKYEDKDNQLFCSTLTQHLTEDTDKHLKEELDKVGLFARPIDIVKAVTTTNESEGNYDVHHFKR
jgi:hypothetical protein